MTLSIGRGEGFGFEGVEFDRHDNGVVHVTWVMEGTFGEKALSEEQRIALSRLIDPDLYAEVLVLRAVKAELLDELNILRDR